MLYQKGPIIQALKEAAQQRGKTTEKLFDEPAYKELLRGDPKKRFSAANIPGTDQQILVESKTGHMLVKVELLPQVSLAVFFVSCTRVDNRSALTLFCSLHLFEQVLTKVCLELEECKVPTKSYRELFPVIQKECKIMLNATQVQRAVWPHIQDLKQVYGVLRKKEIDLPESEIADYVVSRAIKNWKRTAASAHAQSGTSANQGLAFSGAGRGGYGARAASLASQYRKSNSDPELFGTSTGGANGSPPPTPGPPPPVLLQEELFKPQSPASAFRGHRHSSSADSILHITARSPAPDPQTQAALLQSAQKTAALEAELRGKDAMIALQGAQLKKKDEQIDRQQSSQEYQNVTTRKLADTAAGQLEVLTKLASKVGANSPSNSSSERSASVGNESNNEGLGVARRPSPDADYVSAAYGVCMDVRTFDSLLTLWPLVFV